MRTILFLLLITACNDSTNGTGSDLSVDLSSVDLTSRPGGGKCGAVTCASDEICAVFAPRPEMGTPGMECAKLPAACVSDATCACLDANGGAAHWCYQLYSASLLCDDQFAGQIICTST
jgi:hypothetical protein